ncbi:MAG: hypothetical protein AAB490_05015 [Patescibacteria group bacterium]
MYSVSLTPKPPQAIWAQDDTSPGRRKEVVGGRSVFHRHCGIGMRRIHEFKKTPQGVTYRLNNKIYFCEVCELRKTRASEMEL